MGDRANALTDYEVPDYHNQAAVISLLTPALPAALAVADYWRSVQADYEDMAESWSAHLVHCPPEDDILRYNGPGHFSVAFGERVARVSGPCRWSGFCTVAALQSLHTTAFRAISRALGGQRMVLIPDYDPVEGLALYDAGSLDDCVAMLEQRWGQPQSTIAVVTDDVEAYYRRQHRPWFVERL